MPRPALRLRPEWGVAGGLAICSLAAITRTLLSGQLAVSDEPTPFGPYVWCVFGLGMALAGACYLFALCRRGAPLGRSQLAAAFAIHLCAAVAPPLTSNDVFMNLAYGKLTNLGINPYSHAPVDLPVDQAEFRRVDWPRGVSAWGPLTTYASAWATRQGDGKEAFVAFKLALLLASIGAVLVAYRFCGSLPAAEAGGSFAFFAFNPLLAWELSGQVHNDALMLLPTTAFVWGAVKGRHVLAASAVGLGVAVKLAAAPALALYLISVARSARARALLAATAACGLLVFAWAPFWEDASTLGGVLVFLRSSPAVIQNTFASLIRLLGNLAGEAEPPLRVWTLASRFVILVAAIVFAVRSTTTERALEGALRFTALSLALGLSYVQPWYATWLLPLALAPAARDLRIGVALYTALMPALYLTGAAGALAIVIVQGVGLVLVFAPERLARVFNWPGSPERDEAPA